LERVLRSIIVDQNHQIQLMQSVLDSKGYSQFDDCLVPMTIADHDHDHDDEVEDNVSDGTNGGSSSSGANMIFTTNTRLALTGVVGIVAAGMLLWTVM
jgi:hypothetical protein